LKAFIKDQGRRLGAIILPILISLYPTLALYAQNLGEMRPSEINRSILISLFIALVITLFFVLIFRNFLKGALQASLLILLLFSYGHIYSILKQISYGSFLIGRHRFLLPVLILLGVASFLYLWHRNPVSKLSFKSLLAFVVILLSIPLFQIASFHFRVALQSRTYSNIPSRYEEAINVNHRGKPPDIYYIIPDGYARWDVLKQRYGYDNSGFNSFLEERGFYVAYKSYTNYPTTDQSLASSLNMSYVQDVVPEDAAGPNYQFNELLEELIQNSKLRSILESLGYKTVGFTTGFMPTELLDADIVYTTEMGTMDEIKARGAINSFESHLIDNSILKIFLDYEALEKTVASEYIKERMKTPFTVQRGIVLSQFDSLKKITNLDEPKFIFVHILSPHEPYKFGRDGEDVGSFQPFSLADNQGDINEVSKKMYIDEIHYLTGRLEETVKYILTNSKRPVIIVIQSDHGVGEGLDEDQPKLDDVQDKYAILNAYYIPFPCEQFLYEEISPVNSFRIILNCLFDTEYPPLDDISYTGYDIFSPVDEYIDDWK